jgi:hypothetical protein
MGNRAPTNVANPSCMMIAWELANEPRSKLDHDGFVESIEYEYRDGFDADAQGPNKTTHTITTFEAFR